MPMDLSEAHAVLFKAYDHYVTLKPEEWDNIRSRWHLRTFKKNELLLAEGQVEQNLNFIIEGAHRVYCLDKDGDEQTVGFGYRGDFSGGIYSIFSRKPSEYFLEALTAGSMLVLAVDDFHAFFDQYPIMDRWGRLVCQDFFIGRGKREREMMTMTAQERFQRLFKESPHLFQFVPHKHLASYIGMRPETFSRMWKSL